MLILTMRTDKPEAELAIFNDRHHLKKLSWLADRQLAITINSKLEELLGERDLRLDRLGGIVFFSGPGSFTGLRIGAAVANALAYAQNIPIVSASGSAWQQSGIGWLLAGKNDRLVRPHYDRPPATTPPRHF